MKSNNFKPSNQNPIAMKETIILRVQIDYTHEGRDPQHAETAAAMVLKTQWPTIENGVQITKAKILNLRPEIKLKEPKIVSFDPWK